MPPASAPQESPSERRQALGLARTAKVESSRTETLRLESGGCSGLHAERRVWRMPGPRRGAPDARVGLSRDR